MQSDFSHILHELYAIDCNKKVSGHGIGRNSGGLLITSIMSISAINCNWTLDTHENTVEETSRTLCQRKSKIWARFCIKKTMDAIWCMVRKQFQFLYALLVSIYLITFFLV